MTDVDTSPAERLARLRSNALAELELAADTAALEHWRISHLGRRSALSTVLSGLGTLSPDERKTVGSAANSVKRDLEEAYTAREHAIRDREVAAALERERVDVTLPGRPPALGA